MTFTGKLSSHAEGLTRRDLRSLLTLSKPMGLMFQSDFGRQLLPLQ
jgi:hypothetical protein